MSRDLAISVLLAFFGTHVVYAEIHGVEETRTDFERLAAEMPCLCLLSVLYDRPEHSFQAADPKKVEAHFRILAKATDRTYTKEALLSLLNHGDAKVQTLAAAALFDREDLTILPTLIELCDDNSATFDGHPELSEAWLRMSGIGPPAKKQTVGYIATNMVSFYMQRSGFGYGIAHETEPGFTEYWEPRKHRSHCAAWFAVQLARASQGTSPTQKNCIHRIRLLRKRIDKLPPDERTWTFLWLNDESGSDALITEKELVEACISIGPDKLLLMLQKRIPSDDPDLQPRRNDNWPYKRMQLFVLRHADELLRRGHGDALLACELWERDYQKHKIGDPTITSWWAVAAAHLEPSSASQILHAAMNRFQGEFDSEERATICIAMWQMCGMSEVKYILNWFFGDSPERGSFPNCRRLFIEAMSREANGREIIAELIKDQRLEELDWQSLESLIRAVNRWEETPIITEEEMRKAWHPLGQRCFHREKEKARKDYPKETEDLHGHLRDWRNRLRTTVSRLLEREANGGVSTKTDTGEGESPP
jgi:hypothetical protein